MPPDDLLLEPVDAIPRDASGEEFYVGYQPACPPHIARRMRAAVAAVAALAVGLPIALVASQAALAPATFEYGVVRTYEGVVREAPVPVLEVPRPGVNGEAAATSQLLLVAPGKHGARPDVAGLDGRRVRVAGSLIYREGQAMLELASAVAPLAGAGASPAAPSLPVEDLGEATLFGEIVDAKCHLGVMNPGDGKGHRGCAARCLSGGIPAILRVRDAEGTVRRLLLVGDDGRTLGREILDRVAEPVAVTGRVERRGDLLLLYAEPARIRRLGEEG